MNRRTFLTVLMALVPACAMRTTRPPTGTITGHVMGRGLRFGRITEKNPSGQYNTMFMRPGVPILLYDDQLNLINKTFTDDGGWFRFTNLKLGRYTVQAIGEAVIFNVVEPDPYCYWVMFGR